MLVVDAVEINNQQKSWHHKNVVYFKVLKDDIYSYCLALITLRVLLRKLTILSLVNQFHLLIHTSSYVLLVANSFYEAPIIVFTHDRVEAGTGYHFIPTLPHLLYTHNCYVTYIYRYASLLSWKTHIWPSQLLGGCTSPILTSEAYIPNLIFSNNFWMITL